MRGLSKRGRFKIRSRAGRSEGCIERCYHVVDDLESDFIWRIWWFDDRTKYRKIALLVDPSALRAYTQEAELRPASSSSFDPPELPLLRLLRLLRET